MTSVALRLARALWAPFAVVAVHDGIARLFNHYSILDPGFHFFGGVAGAYCLSTLLRLFPSAPVPSWVRTRTAVVAITFGVALLWEGAEGASDVFLGTHIQEGWLDTGSDLVLGFLGAVIAARLFFRRRRSAAAQ